MNKKKKILLSISLIILIIGVVLIWSSNEIGSIFSSETANSRIDKLGFTKYYSGNYKEAFKKLLPMAEGGNSNAQVSLGNLYAAGLGTEQNYKQAYFWYKKASKLGNSDAMVNIALMYESGNYLKKNTDKAIELYNKAIATNNNITAQNNLSNIYFNNGNEKEGLKLLSHAADSGNSSAQSQLGMSYYLGLYGQKINFGKAYKLLEKSSKQGSPQGQNNLALVYYEGKATKKNDFKAYKWFYIASEYGHNSKSKELMKAYKFNLTDTQKQQAINEAQQWIKTHKEINLNLVGVK